MIGSAALMLRLSRDFGKQENVAALHRDDTGPLTTLSSVCRAPCRNSAGIDPAQAPLVVRPGLFEAGSSIIRNAAAKRSTSTRSSHARCNEMP